MMSYLNETDFVIENKQLVYPEIVTDGLQLYYDAKGKRDTDYHRDTMLDMSGNKNHGTLQNFAYEKHSGYKDGLVFDYIDDKLVRPTLSLQPNDFTFMLNGNIISFSPDGTVKRVQDGEVVETKGVNLIKNGDFSDGLNGWPAYNLDAEIVNGKAKAAFTAVYPEIPSTGAYFAKSGISLYKDHEYYTRFEIEPTKETSTSVYINGNWAEYVTFPANELSIYSGICVSNSTKVSAGSDIRINHRPMGDYVVGDTYTIDNVMMINLTETFGVGNEPTKEQMDEIINQFGFIHNAQDLIDRIEYKGNDLGDIENIIDGLYKTDVLSGEEIYTDKADDAVVHTEVDGKSYQHAGNGKNMFNKYLLSDRSKFQLSTYSSSPAIQLKPNTTYTLSASRVNPSPDGNQLVLNIMDATGGIPVYGSPDYNDTRIRAVFNMYGPHPGLDNVSYTFTTPESGLIFYSYYDNKVGLSSEGNWFTDVMIDAQLEEGSVVTEYEPSAPTPDYPIDIHSLNDFDIVSSVGKENLLPTSFSSYAIATYGYVKLVDEETPLILKLYEKDNSVDMSGIYFGFSKIGTSPAEAVSWVYANGAITTNLNLESEMRTTDYKYFSFHPNNLATFSKIFKRYDIKIEKGTVATPYSLAPEDIVESDNHPLIDKINLLLDEPLRSVRHIKDRLFRDSDGLWKVERNVGEYVVPEITSTLKYGDRAAIAVSVPNKHNGHSSSTFDRVPYLKSSLDYYYYSNPANFVIVGKVSDTVETLDSLFRGTKLIYVINPTIEILDQESQDKLNNLRSFSESNYVYAVDGNTNLLDTVLLLNNHWYPSSGAQQNPVSSSGQTATKDAISVYPGAQIHFTKSTAGDNYWRIVWVDKNNNVIRRETPTDNNLVLATPSGAYGMRVSCPNGSNPVIKFVKSDISQAVSENLKPTLHTKFLYNNWYKEDRVINNLMIYNRALTNEEMLQNYKTIKQRWGM